MGVFEEARLAAEADVYSDALKKVNAAVQKQQSGETKIDTGNRQGMDEETKDELGDEMDQYGDDLMRELEQEAMESLQEIPTTAEESLASYQQEYDSVIACISMICSQIASPKTN